LQSSYPANGVQESVNLGFLQDEGILFVMELPLALGRGIFSRRRKNNTSFQPHQADQMIPLRIAERDCGGMHATPDFKNPKLAARWQ